MRTSLRRSVLLVTMLCALGVPTLRAQYTLTGRALLYTTDLYRLSDTIRTSY